MHASLRVLQAVILASAFTSVRSTFTFNFGTPTQCDPLSISWTGGQPPFNLLMIPLFGTPRNITIPASAFSGGKGSYQQQLPFHQSQQFLLSMGDATGDASGGVSTVLSTGASVGGTACNTTDPGPAFPFELNSALVQCRYYTFSGYDTAVQPVTIIGYIPGGNVITLYPSSSQSSFSWQADLAAGTSVVFAMLDAQGRSGGASDLKTSGASNDNTCLNSTSPSSTSHAPSATSSSAPSSSGTSSTTIGLAVLGGVVALAIVIALGVFYFRRLSRSKRAFYDGGAYRPKSASQRVQPVNLLDNTENVDEHDQEFTARVTPYSYQASIDAGSGRQYDSHSDLNAPEPPTLPPPPQSPATERSKAQRAGVRDHHRPQRFIVHTDLEDTVDQNDEVVELPPQYDERRAPISSLDGSFASLPGSEQQQHLTSNLR